MSRFWHQLIESSARMADMHLKPFTIGKLLVLSEFMVAEVECMSAKSPGNLCNDQSCSDRVSQLCHFLQSPMADS